jgi:hypothetical protein
MKNLKAITFLGGLAASIVAGGCGASTDGTNGDGHGSATGMDGGMTGSGSAMGAGGDVSAGGSASTGSGGAGSGSTGGGMNGSSGGATSGSTGGAGSTASGGTQGGPITIVNPVGTTDPVCANQSVAASAGVLDVFIMLDRSLSMDDAAAGGSKWEVITGSLNTFVAAPESATISAGLGFFGIPTGTRNRDSSCTAADYAKPVVPIGLLGGASGNAGKITTAIGTVNPATNTPTEPALQGAINYASTWAKANPTHKVVVVFATDGLPNGCNSSIDGAAKIAAAGMAASPPIPTYVIGVFGDDDCPGGVAQGQKCTVVSNTNQIAKSGGTGSAFIVNASANTGSQFLGALNAIRGANQVGCDFKVPAPAKGKAIDFSRATVRYTPGKGTAQTLPWESASTKCTAEGGWYYDSVTAPNHVLLCGATCKAVTADTAAKIDVVLACQPPGTSTGSGGTGSGVGGSGSSGAAGAPGGSGSSTGAGGTSSGAGGSTGAGGADSCLLAGQSCQSAAECCGGLCTGGVCESLVR